MGNKDNGIFNKKEKNEMIIIYKIEINLELKYLDKIL